MTDLDRATLRMALKSPGDQGDPVDVTQIMTRGRRLRARRRLAAVAWAACAVAILTGAGTAIASQAGRGTRDGAPGRRAVRPRPARRAGRARAGAGRRAAPARARTAPHP